MINADETALICDLAETYHIYDYKSLPLKMVAAFSAGLRENSRIKMCLNHVKYPFETLLLAAIFDGINLKNWMLSGAAREGVQRPKALTDSLLGKSGEDGEETEDEIVAFDSGEAFEKMRRKLLTGEMEWQNRQEQR